jgi:hypothetical protein
MQSSGRTTKRGGDHSVDPGVGCSISSERILEKLSAKMWTGFIWLRIEASGRLL